MNYKIENCANGAESALRAQEGGAYRVELCAGMPEGGTTPSYGEIEAARRLIDIRLHVIIRPRGGDFLYNDIEKQIILSDIRMCKNLGVDGVVVGCLTPDGDVDVPFLQLMVDTAAPMDVTFHRAFDVCRNQSEALEALIDCGCSRVLTSGGEANVMEGIDALAGLVKLAKDRIIVMPGCGVTADNIPILRAVTGATEFHLSARSEVDSTMRYRNPKVSMGGTVTIQEYKRPLTDPNKIRAAVQALNIPKTC